MLGIKRIPLSFNYEAASREDQEQAIALAQIEQYDELLLTGKDGSPDAAIVDSIVTDPNDGKKIVERTRFYKDAEKYMIETLLSHSVYPVERLAAYKDTETNVWLLQDESPRPHDFFPEPSKDIRPFAALLERCFGKL